jgi:alpha-L-rhamnosidase
MIYDVGSTISLEAWDNKFKPNQDWNHAWGAAPANLIPRRLMGIMPIEPGFKKARIQPQIGSLTEASIKYPTPLGPIEMSISRKNDKWDVEITIPKGMIAEFVQPWDKKVVKLKKGRHSLKK